MSGMLIVLDESKYVGRCCAEELLFIARVLALGCRVLVLP